MNVFFVDSVPTGEFAEISVLKTGWLKQFQTLLGQRRAIRFDFYPMPGLPSEVRERIHEGGYHDVVLQKDQWQHFFIPDMM